MWKAPFCKSGHKLGPLRLNLGVILAVYQNTINISLTVVCRVTALLGFLDLEAFISVSNGPIKGSWRGCSPTSRKFLKLRLPK